MILFLILAGLFSLSGFFSLPEKLSNLSVTFHYFCLQSLPPLTENPESLEALVCGKNLQQLELKHLLVETSLIHIFIVSGSHFLFLRKIMARVPFLNSISILILAFYALATLFQPPAARALLFLLLIEFCERKKLSPPPVLLVFYSGLLSLALCPAWIFSRSLVMSLLAALVMVLMRRSSSLVVQSTLYGTMTFCLWGFSNPQPFSILLNLLLGPVIGSVLFPLGLLVVFARPLAPLFDHAMSLLIWILRKNRELLPASSLTSTPGILLQWVVFLGLVSAGFYFLRESKRRKALRA